LFHFFSATPDILTDRPIFYDNFATDPGLLAGGPGSGSDAGPDWRKVTGSVYLKLDATGGGGVLRTKFNYEIFDCIDFCPGNCGPWYAHPLTMPLSIFEASGAFYDVPFQVDFEAKVVEFTIGASDMPVCTGNDITSASDTSPPDSVVNAGIATPSCPAPPPAPPRPPTPPTPRPSTTCTSGVVAGHTMNIQFVADETHQMTQASYEQLSAFSDLMLHTTAAEDFSHTTALTGATYYWNVPRCEGRSTHGAWAVGVVGTKLYYHDHGRWVRYRSGTISSRA